MKIYDDDAPGFYREGDYWVAEIYGPGPAIPLMNIGPGPHPDPRVYGPIKRDVKSIPSNHEFFKRLEKILEQFTDYLSDEELDRLIEDSKYSF